MAEEPILGLFDSDTNFLDELTGGAADLGGVMSSDGDSMLAQGMQPLGSTSEMGPGPGMQNSMMMNQQSQQGPGAYQQMRQDGYGGMGGGSTSMGGPQQAVMGHQYSSADGGYGQYSSMPKLHHAGEGMMGVGMQHQGNMQVMQQQQQQQQFGSPPAGGMMQQHAGYPGYSMGGGHMGQQPQQMGMMGQQGTGWNQAQTSPTHPQYMAQQQQQCMQQQMPHSQAYLGQHDYSMQQNSHQQHMGHYGDSSGFMQTMGSPGPGMQQASPMGSPGGMAMMGGPMQHPPHASQPYPAQSPIRQPSAAMAGYGLHHQQQQPPQRYPSDYLGQRPQMSPVSGYPYPQQHQNTGPQGMGSDGPGAMGHYPSQAPGSYMPPYSGASHTNTTPSPRPPHSSQSMTPSHSAPMSQGNYGQSSLQELEQLVSPNMPSSGMPNTNPYQQIMQSSGSSAQNMTSQSPIYSSANFQTTTAPSTSSMPGNAPVQSSTSMGMGATGPLSPNPGMRQGMGQGMSQQSGLAMEIQRLEKQIQHLFNMPQTQQISQQMLDLQERLRILKAQQQQQIMQMQRQQQSQQQQQQTPMGSPTRMQQKPGYGMQQQHPSMMPQRPRMPGQLNGPLQSQMPGLPQMGMGGQHMGQSGSGPMMGGQTAQQLKVQGPQHMGQQISPQRPPSQSTPISSPQKIQPFQSPTSSTSGDGIPGSGPTTSQPMVIQQAADSMTDNMQMTPPNMHSLPILDGDLGLNGQSKVVTSDPLPATVTEIAEAQEGQGEKPKRKRQRKPKGEKEDKPPKERKPKPPKTPKEPKPPKEPKAPKTPRTPKSPKTPKEPKEPKTPRVRKSKKAKEASGGTPCSDTVTPADTDAEKMDESSETQPAVDGETKVEETTTETETPKKKTPKEKKPRTPKSVVKALKKPSSKKKKPPASLFLKSRKRKRAGSDGSDIEMNMTPPGSPNADESNKRRSARNTKRKKYLDDLDLNLSDDENQTLEALEGNEGPVAMKTETEENAAMIVEKILGSRIRKRDEEEQEENPDAEEEEFLVKYKNYSYLHCEWRTIPELERDKRIHSKVKRYKMKKMQLNSLFEEPIDEEYFNPDYVEVDRVLDCVTSTDPGTQEEVTHYLVKWRSLSYEESTWELAQDVDPRKVQLFKDLRTPPPEDERQVLARPKPSQWKKEEEMRTYKGDNQLREYQLEGLNWLTFCWYNGQNCILADEMGLGKTIQSITFLSEIFQYGIKGPFLVIVPLSTIGNWQREFETWTDMNAVVYHGTSNSRAMIQEYELFYKDENGQRIPDLFKFHALITTYEIIIADVELLSSIEWRACIIDEAHRLKNKNCRLLEGLRLFDLEHRVLLTGTPLQNNTEELFSLLNFLNPGKFSSAQAFTKEFGDLKTETQVDQLKEILKPMMLRRLKEDVEKNLAPKEETIIEVELTNIQKKYYRAILERNFQFLSKGGSANMPSLMNTMMELRKCCNHPYLINGAEEQIVYEMGARGDIEQLLMALVNSSGKMVLLDKLLPRLKQNGHKVLIFSQMIRVLDIIEDYLMQKKYTFERLDGRIRGNLRQEAIDRFSKPDSDRFAFLLCTRAGGLGINLTAADTVIIYDSDWNPQNDLQAQARCHRIGQSKAVKVYRLICRNSYEREMFDKASLKLGLDKAVLQSMGGDKQVNPQSQLSKKEVEDLLKKGAYGALMEDDSAGDKFCEEDIDLILQRRTKVIQIESEGKGSTFAKASFSMTSNRTDIDINDPNFWQKWAKKADIDVDSLANKNDLIIEEPRQRRQTTRYGKEESVVDISDLESSSDTDDDARPLRKGRRSRRGRANDDGDFSYNDDVSSEGYTRSDCFKVEKHLLVYGWGRWQDIIAHARFKQTLVESDVEIIARAILAHSLKFYKGDERIKEFIWDLISSGEGELKNHTGLSAPVPRGRKGKKAKEKKPDEGRPLDFDPEAVLDNGYKRHLHRHSNKVLLRVRLLYYIKQEVIGDQAAKVFQGANCSEIDIPQPNSDGEVPAAWWDECADRCLLIGVFKHGYEKFNQVRQDPALCFLSRCGPPDGADLLAEQNDDKEDEEEMDDKLLKEDEDCEVSQSSAPDITSKPQPISIQTDETGEGGKLPFPSASDLNTRLRRVITGYQRNHKKMMLKHEQFARRLERRERAELMVKERLSKRKEFQQNLFWCRNSRWSRREEADFYRTVSTFGVEFDRETGCFRWHRFRALARLDRKYDETLTEYFHAFYYMCQSVCGKFRKEDRVPPPPNGIFVEPITEERASRCLARIDLLNKIRDEVLTHPKLDERIKLCQPSFDMPSWWQCGKHDKELLIGAARHGVARTDYNILRDQTLSFHEVLKNSGRHLRSTPQHYAPSPLISAGHSNLHMSPALASELREDDLESDAKSQDSVDLHDSRTSSPPPLHNGKVQYSHPSAENDNDPDGPPNLEPAISPLPRKEEDERTQSPSAEEGFKPERTEEKEAGASDSRELGTEGCDIQKMEGVEEEGQEKKSDSRPSSPKPDSDKGTAETCSGDQKGVSGSPSKSPSESESVSTTDLDTVEKSTSDEPEAKPVSEKIESQDDTEKKTEEQTSGLVKEESSEKESKSDVTEKPASSEEKVVKEEAMEVDETCEVKEDKKADDVDPEKDKTEAKSEYVKDESAGKELPEDLTEVSKEETVEMKTLESQKLESKVESTPVKEEKVDYVKLKEKIIKGEIEQLHEEELKKMDNRVSTGVGSDGMSPLPTSYSGLYGEDSPYMEMEGLEPGEIVPGRPFLGPAIEWPKDRVIFHRLEHICYTIDHGEWPFTRRPSSYISTTPFDSRSGTPVGSSTPRPEGESEGGESLDMSQVMRQVIEADKDFEVHLSENEGLKMTFHKRGRGRGRARYEIDAEKVARVQQLLNQSAQAMASSDSESQPEPMNLSAPTTAAQQSSSPAVASAIPTTMTNSPLSGSPMSDMDQLHQSLAEQGLVFPERRRRGRKRKAEKMAELAMAEALAKREQARILASFDPETRVPVINVEDGSILTGEEAPLKHELERWLLEHPGYMISPQPASFMQFPIPGPIPEEQPPRPPELQSGHVARRRGRRPKLDPRTLDARSLTGEENVSVIERGSGRKITGAKAPPLKHLKEWLDQNPTFDVDPKWGELLRAKGSLPPSMDSRLLKPSGRGRKPRSAGTLHASMLSSDYQFNTTMASMGAFPGAGLMAGFPKLPLGMPFAGMPGLGITNPMMGLAGFPLAGFALPGSLAGLEGEGEARSSKGGGSGSSKDKAGTSTKSEAGTSSSSSASPHPSFPSLYFNPLVYNPLLATQLRNFPIHNFPGLAHMAALNGQPEAGTSEDEQLAARHEKKAPEKTRHSSKSSGEKGHELSKVVDRIRDLSKSEEKAKNLSAKRSSPFSDGVQDLSVQRPKAGPSPAHGKDLSMRHTKPPSGDFMQEQATDLSVRSKPSSTATSIPVSTKAKNKIFNSLKLNKIVDSLKDKVMKIEEKSKKKEDEPTKEAVPAESNENKESSHAAQSSEPEASSSEAPLKPAPEKAELPVGELEPEQSDKEPAAAAEEGEAADSAQES